MRAQAPAQRARRGRLLVVHGVSKMTTATASFGLMHIKSGWGLLCAVAWVGHLATVSCLKPKLVVIDCAVHASSRQVRMQLTYLGTLPRDWDALASKCLGAPAVLFRKDRPRPANFTGSDTVGLTTTGVGHGRSCDGIL